MVISRLNPIAASSPIAPSPSDRLWTGQDQHLAVCDETACESQEGFVDVSPAFPADAQASEAMEPGEGALDHPTAGAQSGAVPGPAAGDGRHDTASVDLLAVDVVVVATVCEQCVRLPARAPGPAANRWDGIEQRQQLGDVIAVATGQKDRERSTAPIGDQVVLGAGTAPVDRRRARVCPPFSPWRGRSRLHTGTSPASLPRSAQRAGPREGVARHQLHSSPAADANTSCPSRSPGPAAGTPTESRCAARTRSRTARPGPATACGPDTETVAHAAAATVQGGPTTHPTRTTVTSPQRAERSTLASDTATRADPPHCVSRSKGTGFTVGESGGRHGRSLATSGRAEPVSGAPPPLHPLRIVQDRIRVSHADALKEHHQVVVAVRTPNRKELLALECGVLMER
ncbi:hypothetical protein SHL15_7642 [Streptomyces hygroscopicus subsp. limoneus]|nr:hypothetical protein SHL15_7642 [Streptomyces hygroscopicus subsp. limoneus]